MSEGIKLTKKDKKEIRRVIEKAKERSKNSISAQDSIPFERMYKDGICMIRDRYYTKTVRFEDINYQLSQNEDKTAIFDCWCEFLNYFDSSVTFQLSFLNMSIKGDKYTSSIEIPLTGDKYDDIRREYTDMLRSQLAKGNNGQIKSKYITFGIECDSIKEAKPRIERIESDILSNFKKLGVTAYPLSGYERLELIYNMLHIDEPDASFSFSWDWLIPSGLSVKDFVAPSSFEFKKGKEFRCGSRYGTISFVQILAPELSLRRLACLLFRMQYGTE